MDLNNQLMISISRIQTLSNSQFFYLVYKLAESLPSYMHSPSRQRADPFRISINEVIPTLVESKNVET